MIINFWHGIRSTQAQHIAGDLKHICGHEQRQKMGVASELAIAVLHLDKTVQCQDKVKI